MKNRPYEISIWDDSFTYFHDTENTKLYGEENKVILEPTSREIEEEAVYKIQYIPDEDEDESLGVVFRNSGYGDELTIGSEKRVTVEKPEGVSNAICRLNETKIGIIGSDMMTTQHRAINSTFTTNVNGSNTLTFSIYHRYYDNQTGEYVENPFTKLLTNERKVKLRLGNPGDPDVEWYDFIIKNVQESSDSNIFTYTCTDLFVNELSKTGFSITLDGKLENNIGTPNELATRVLEGTDWQVGEGDIIHTYHEEPVYVFDVPAGTTLRPVAKKDGEKDSYITKEEIEVLGFYSLIANQKKDVQVLCYVDDNGKPIQVKKVGDPEESAWPLDETGVVVASEHIENSRVRQFLVDATYSDAGKMLIGGTTIFSTLDTKKRGRRIVRAQISKYDANLGKYVSQYKKDNDDTIYWAFSETDTDQMTIVTNYVTNGENFKNTNGWEVTAEETDGDEILFGSNYVTPPTSDKWDALEGDQIVKSWLKLKKTSNTSYIANTGLWDYLYDYDSIAKDTTFVLCVKYVDYESGGTSSIKATPCIRYYEHKWETTPIEFNATGFNNEKIKNQLSSEGYNQYCKFVFPKPLSHNDIVEGHLRLCFESSSDFGIEKVVLFPQVLLKEKDGETNVVEKEIEATKLLLPGEYLDKPLALPVYKVYKDGASEGQDSESMTYDEEIRGTSLPDNYKPNFDPTGAARVQITAKESNRFNILQDIAEAAECWVKFKIEHDNQTGYIKLDDNGKPIKKVTFHKFVGKQNFAGFKYGINLKSIQRTVESNQLVTKLIVKPNSNEFAKNKSCTIQRAKSNPSKENIIYNFEYFINHEMIPREEILGDLYGSDSKQGYYNWLAEINKDVDKLSESVSYYGRLVDKLTSECKVWEGVHDAAYAERAKAAEEILLESGFKYDDYVDMLPAGQSFQEYKAYLDDNPNLFMDEVDKNGNVIKPAEFGEYSKQSHFVEDYVYDRLIKIQEFNAQIYNSNQVLNGQNGEGLRTAADLQKKNLKETQAKLNQKQKEKAQKEKEFYVKYSRFVQEGTWISEDFYDDELYYLEASNVSNTSAFPQTTYSINVLDVSQVEGYENITFSVGDKTYIQDTEFFGYVMKDRGDGIKIRTPYQEEVVCSEIKRVLDDGSQNTIKVQNYKNHFEDLFQRIRATTQQVQYHSGEYSKGAQILTEDGEIVSETLEKSLERNKLMLQNATNESVTWDNTGITSINLNSPNLMTRLIGGAVMVSKDGGITWSHAITGEGINAEYLVAGTIDVSKINILAEKGKPFSWTKDGIIARRLGKNGEYSTRTYVRFNELGLGALENSKEKVRVGKFEVDNVSHYGLVVGNDINKGDIALYLSKDGKIVFGEGKTDLLNEIEGAFDTFKNETNDRINKRCIIVTIFPEEERRDKSLFYYTKESSSIIYHYYKGNTWSNISTMGSFSGVYKDDGKTKYVNENDVYYLDGITPDHYVYYDATGKEWKSTSDPTVAGLTGSALGTSILSNDLRGAAEDYTNSAAKKLDDKVVEYLNGGNGTVVTEDYVISPYIAGGYLDIAGDWKNNTYRVLIDPKGKSTKPTANSNAIFKILKDDSLIMGIDNNGDTYFKGKVIANSGTIGGWGIGIDSKDPHILEHKTDNTWTFFAPGGRYENSYCSDGVSRNLTIGSGTPGVMSFGVTTDGEVFASKGKIAQWSISDDALIKKNPDGYITFMIDGSGIQDIFRYVGDREGGDWILWAVSGDTDPSYITGNFGVTNEGILYAQDAHISGTIFANGGSIGNLEIDQYTKGLVYFSGDNEISIGKNAFLRIQKNGKNIFYVNNSGELGVNIETDNSATSLTLNNLNIALGITTSLSKAQITITSQKISLDSNTGSISGLWSICGVKFDNPNVDRNIIVSEKSGINFGQSDHYHDLYGYWYVKNSMEIVNGATLKNKDGGVEISSDERVKHSILSLKDNYDTLFDNLHPVVFKYNSSTSNRFHCGFIAQQVVHSLSQANLTTQDFAGVCQDDVNDPESQWYIRYDEFISLNTWQIQKLKTRVSALESELATLKQKFETLSNL